MHKILFATIAGYLVTFQPVHAAIPATGADSIAAIVSDFDAFNRAQDPIRAAQRGDKEAARIWPGRLWATAIFSAAKADPQVTTRAVNTSQSMGLGRVIEVRAGSCGPRRGTRNHD